VAARLKTSCVRIPVAARSRTSCERWLPDTVVDVTGKDTLICLKMLHTSLLINFTTEHVILARSLHEAINALEHRQAVSVTNIVTGWTFHVNTYARSLEMKTHTASRSKKYHPGTDVSARTSRIIE